MKSFLGYCHFETCILIGWQFCQPIRIHVRKCHQVTREFEEKITNYADQAGCKLQTVHNISSHTACWMYEGWRNFANCLQAATGLQGANVGKMFTMFRVTPHAERMRGDLKRHELLTKICGPQDSNPVTVVSVCGAPRWSSVCTAAGDVGTAQIMQCT